MNLWGLNRPTGAPIEQVPIQNSLEQEKNNDGNKGSSFT